MFNNDDITEFVSLDVEELHLVGEAANQFHPLVAKSAKKGNHMSKKSEPVLKAGEADRMLEVALSRMEKAAAAADRDGDVWKAEGIRREVAALKLARAEKGYIANGQVSNYGPGVRRLFDNTSAAGKLGEDTAVSGF